MSVLHIHIRMMILTKHKDFRKPSNHLYTEHRAHQAVHALYQPVFTDAPVTGEHSDALLFFL